MYDDDDIPRRQKRRGGESNIFAYFLLFVGVIGGIYYAWGGDFSAANTKRIMKGDFSSFGKISLNSGTSTIKTGETLQDKGKKIIDSTLEAAVKKPKEAVTEFVQDLSSTAVESVRKEAAQVFGLSVTGVSALPSNISIVRPAGQLMSFVVGAESEDIIYTINWGDTQTTSGTVPQKTEKTITHSWVTAGDYLITVETVGTQSGKKIYLFPMSIQK